MGFEPWCHGSGICDIMLHVFTNSFLRDLIYCHICHFYTDDSYTYVPFISTFSWISDLYSNYPFWSLFAMFLPLVNLSSYNISSLVLPISFYFLKLFYCCSITVVCLFSPLVSTPPQPNPAPYPASTLPLGFVHVSYVVVPDNLSPITLLMTPSFSKIHSLRIFLFP